jgi:hypothetical protein
MSWQCNPRRLGASPRQTYRQEDVMELTTTRWDVQVFLSEHDGTTHAEARLFSSRREHLSGTGTARLSAEDHVDVAEIGYELATARALKNLGERLLHVAEADIEALAQY